MSLAQVTRETRLGLKIAGALLVLGLLVFLIFKGGAVLQQTFFPKPPPPPEEKFGKLPEVSFPAQAGSFPQFRVNTVSGLLPSFPPTVRVFKFIELNTNLTALQSAREKAAQLSYTQNEQQVTPTEYRWSKPDQNNTLLYNIVSLDFSVASDYLVNPTAGGGISDQEAVTSAVANFIGTLGSNTSDIDFGNSVFSYYTANAGLLTNAPSADSALFVRMYLLQKPVEKMKIYYPTADPSSLYFTLNGSDVSNVMDASYNHQTPDLTQSSTYPIKTAAAAFQDLQDGKGFIVSPTAASSVDITDVALGYYIGNNADAKYLMPIVIFFGKDNFRAYVSAVAD